MNQLEALAQTPAEKYAVKMVNATSMVANSKLVQLPGKLLQRGDNIAKTLNTRMMLRQQAGIEFDEFVKNNPKLQLDLATNKKLADEEYSRIYQGLLESKIGPDGQILDSEMIRSATNATFQEELETGFIKGLSNFINKDAPILKQVIPFIKTPWNITIHTVSHAPGIARMLPNWERVMKYGTPAEQAALKGREALGLMYVTLGVMGAQTGHITGAGPADPKLREVWRRNNEPYSVKIPGTDTFVRYKDLPVLGIVLPIIADSVALVQLLPDGDQDKVWAHLMYSIANALSDQSYVQGVKQLGVMLNPNLTTPERIQEGTMGFANSLIPMSAARNSMENALKEGMYEYKTWFDEMIGRASGGLLGEKVPSYDILTGEPIVTGAEGIWNQLMPFRIVGKDVSPLAETLGVLDFRLTNEISNNLNGLKLTPEEESFIRQRMYADGALPGELQSYLGSDNFRNDYEYWLRTKGTPEGLPREQSPWYRRLQSIVGTYRTMAANELRYGTDPVAIEFQNRLSTQIRSGNTSEVPEEIRQIEEFTSQFR